MATIDIQTASYADLRSFCKEAGISTGRSPNAAKLREIVGTWLKAQKPTEEPEIRKAARRSPTSRWREEFLGLTTELEERAYEVAVERNKAGETCPMGQIWTRRRVLQAAAAGPGLKSLLPEPAPASAAVEAA
jgi:hypothetical protein